MENDLLYTNKFIDNAYLKTKYIKNNRFKEYIERKKKEEIFKNRIINDNLKTLNNNKVINNEEQYTKRYTIEKKVLLDINSSNRDVSLYPEQNNYKIKIDPPIKNIKEIKLISSEFPNTEQLIRGSYSNRQNNIIKFRLLSDFEKGIGDKIYRIELKPGNYNSTLLQYEIIKKMNKLKRKVDNKNFEFIVSVDEITDNTSISLINGNFSKIMSDGNFNYNYIYKNAFSDIYNFKFDNFTTGSTYNLMNIEKGDKFYILGSNSIDSLPSSIINGQQYIESVPNQSIINFQLPIYSTSENSINRGGDLLKYAKDEYFQLIYDELSPFDIFGFEKKNTLFKETIDNLIVNGETYNIITGVFLSSTQHDIDMIEFETYEEHDFIIGDQIYIDNHKKIYDEFNEVNYLIGITEYGNSVDSLVNSHNLSVGISAVTSGIFNSVTLLNNEFIITNVTNSNLTGYYYYDNDDDDTEIQSGSTIFYGISQIRNGYDGSVEQQNINYSLIQLTQDTDSLNLYYTSREHNLESTDKVLIVNTADIDSINVSTETLKSLTIINTTTIRLDSNNYNNYYLTKAYSFNCIANGITYTFSLTLDRIHDLYYNDLIYTKLTSNLNYLNGNYSKISNTTNNTNTLSIQPLITGTTQITSNITGYMFINSTTKYDIICSTLYNSSKTLNTSLDSGNSYYLRFFTYDDHNLEIVSGDSTKKIYIKNHKISRILNGINTAVGHPIIEVPSNTKFRIQYPHSFYDVLQPLTSVTYTKYGTVKKKKINKLLDLSGDDYILLKSAQLSSFDKNSSNKLNDIFSKILLTGLPGTFLYNTFKTVPKIFNENELPELNEIGFTFYRPDGSLFEFLDRDHSFTLEITTLIEKFGNMNYSSKVGRYSETRLPYNTNNTNNKYNYYP